MSNEPTQQFPAPQGEPYGSAYYNAQPPAPPSMPPVTEPKKKMGKGKKWAIGLGALLALGIVNGIVNPATPSDTAITAADIKANTAKVAAPSVDPSVQASLDKAAADKAAADKAAADKAAADKAAADAKAVADAEAKKKAKEAAAEKARLAAAAKAQAALKNPASYAKISGRTFAKIAKNPDNYSGKKYVIHGYVTQFDSATGTETFRANLDGPKHGEWYDYETNAIVDEGVPGIFDDVVQDDIVTLYVTVDGSFSYDTQIGGNTTVPRFTANIVKVTGSTN